MIKTNQDVLDECDGTTDEDVSVFIPVKTLRRLVAESEALRLAIKELQAASWTQNPDRMGGAYSEDEIRDSGTWK